MGDLMADKPVAINGVIVEPLRQIVDHRGAVLHMLRCDAPFFTRFGEVYFSLIHPRVIKAWKRHRLVTQHFAVPVGQIRLVLYDDRASSPSHRQIAEYDLGRPDHYYLVRIPPMVWYGFQGLSEAPALVANCSDLPHDPRETERLPLDTAHIHYTWSGS